MKKYVIFALLGLLIYGLGCQSPTPPEDQSEARPASLNPNGDSELAVLMREMFEEGERIKKEIAEGKKPTIAVDYEAVLTAQATEPQKAASDTYHAFALTYIETMKALEKASPEEAGKLYVSMVNTCMDCHTQLCPGPKMRIKKLVVN